MAPILQVNVNHTGGAQDCAIQAIREFGASLAVICEPYIVPNDFRWASSSEKDSKVAIYWQKTKSHHLPMRVVDHGDGYVVVSWNNMLVLSCYFSPNRSNREFECYMDNIYFCINRNKNICKEILIMGDFNARHRLVDSRGCNVRGNILRDAIENMDMIVLNNANETTCVRPQGESSVDITIVSSNLLNRISNWRTDKNFITLLDHVLIIMNIDSHEAKLRNKNINKEFPR